MLSFWWIVDTNYKLKVENQINSNFPNIFYNMINLGYMINNFSMIFFKFQEQNS